MVADVTLTGAANNAQKTAVQSQKLAGDFTDFLTLLTTQLQNQDPLNPMDSTEFTNQLVQFSQVEQSINTNQKLDALVAMQLNNASSIALGYVGMDVSYPSTELAFDGATPVKVNYSLSTAAATAKITVVNQAGDVVYTGDAPKLSGLNTLAWDGTMSNGLKAPAGTYGIKIGAIDADGKSIDTQTIVSGRVKGIETQNGIVHVLVGERAVPVTSIINAVVPPTVSQQTGSA
jgi:flagellar basal-body rod modification protein FlgD